MLRGVVAERECAVGTERVSAEHIGEFRYLDAVMKESARLTPATTDVARVVKRPLRIGGINLPAGAGVSAGIYLTHHRADLWPDPERFDPERFIRARPSPYSYFPFGGGDRRCLGAAFSTRMRPAFHAITISPSGGVPVIIDRRTMR